jgi:hypothetical protein
MSWGADENDPQNSSRDGQSAMRRFRTTIPLRLGTFSRRKSMCSPNCASINSHSAPKASMFAAHSEAIERELIGIQTNGVR